MKKLLVIALLFTICTQTLSITVMNSSFAREINGTIKTVRMTPRPGSRPLFTEQTEDFVLREYPDNKLVFDIPQHQFATVSLKTPGSPLQSFITTVKTRDNETEIDIK